jgi:methylthioribose-1-phosphate isomerase
MARRNDADAAADASRREFFRTFGRETVRNAGAVMGAAAELRRASGAAARDLLDGGAPAREVGGLVPLAPPESEASANFNSAFRLGVDELLVLDQRDLPSRAPILSLREPTELASAIRLGAINAGPVLGQVAAYAMGLVAARSVDKDAAGGRELLSAAANTLRGARQDVNALVAATERLEARYREATEDEAGGNGSQPVARSLAAEADAIAIEAQVAHAALGRFGAESIAARGGDAAVNLLMHGDMGPLSNGMVGTGTAILQELLDAGRSVHVWITEAAPSMEGARIGALQLAQFDVPHTVIPDTAVSWLLSTRKLNAVLLRGDTVTVHGETLAPMGSLNVARLALQAFVRVLVVAPSSSWANASVSAGNVLFNLRSPAESSVRETNAATPRPAIFGARLAPTTDLVPAALVDTFLTEAGPRPGGAR